jgi:hypothetical protein
MKRSEQILTWFKAMSINKRRAPKALKDSSTFPTDINEDSEDFTFGDV